MPSQIQAGVYSAVRHYLQAVKDTEADDGATVMARMKATPISGAYTPNGRIREDQRMVHDLYLVQVKTLQESMGPWDFVKLVATIPPDQALRPLDQQVRSGRKIVDRDGRKEILLTPEAGDLRIDVRGDLAGILAVSLKTKTPATRAGVSQVEMVAGIGFEPMTFRL